MYESFFGLDERPFQTTPQLQGYFAAEQIENALETIISCVERGAGPAMVIASTGTGKTTLVLKLQQHFSPTTPVAVLSGTNCRSRRSLLQNALFASGLPYVDMDEGQMRLSLTEFFKSRAENGNGTLLLMDDADALDTDLLEELLGFSSLTGQNGWCVPMVLIGSFRLEEALGSPRVASLNQRIAARCYIDSWSRSEVEAYVTTRMQQSMAKPAEVFLPGAISKICEFTGGVPRVVNQLCDHALVMATSKEQRQIDEFSIDEAWADLQRLPLPTHHVISRSETESTDPTTNEAQQQQDSIVEFGSLEDTDDFGSSTEDVNGGVSNGIVQTQDPVTEQAAPPYKDAAEAHDDDGGYELAPQSTDEPTTEYQPQPDETVSMPATEDNAVADAPQVSGGLAAIGGMTAIGAAAGALANEHLFSQPSDEAEPAGASPDELQASYPEQAEAMHLQRSPVVQHDPATPPPSLTTYAGDQSNANPSLSGMMQSDSLVAPGSLNTPDDLATADNNPETPSYGDSSETETYETYEEVVEALPTPLPPIPDHVGPTGAVDNANNKLPAIPPLGSVPEIPASVAHTPSEPTEGPNFNPFMEEFVEEEVVLERSVRMTDATNSITDSVETTEGQVLTSVIELMEQQQVAAQTEFDAVSDVVDTSESLETTDGLPPLPDAPTPDQDGVTNLQPMDMPPTPEIPAPIPPVAPAVEATSLPPIPDMPLGTPLGTVNEDQQTAEERFDQMLEEHSLLASELPTPSLHSPDAAAESFEGLDEVVMDEQDGPPLGVPRGQAPTVEVDHNFDNLFTQLQEDQ